MVNVTSIIGENIRQIKTRGVADIKGIFRENLRIELFLV